MTEQVPKGTAPLDYYHNFGLREKLQAEAPEMTREDFRKQVDRQTMPFLKIGLLFDKIDRLDKEIEFMAGCNQRAVQQLVAAKAMVLYYRHMSFWERLKFLVKLK